MAPTACTQVLTPACGVFTLPSRPSRQPGHVRGRRRGPARAEGRRAAAPSPPSRSGRPARFRLARASPRSCANVPRPSPHSAADPGPEPGGERRTEPAGRDRHRHRPVPVDRRKDERGVGEVVGAVGPDAGGLGVRVDRPVDVGDPGGGDDQAKRRRVALCGTDAARRGVSDGTSASMSSLNEGAITVTSAPHWSRVRALRAATCPLRRRGRRGRRRRARPGRRREEPRAQSWSRGGPTMPAAMVAKVRSSISTKLPVMRSAS